MPTRQHSMLPLLVSLLIVMVYTWADSSLAQEPREVPLFFAVGIPDWNLPTIDGNLDDWDWVDESFKITIDDMNPLLGGTDDADDLFIELVIGWNQTTNRIYGAVHVHDDALITDKNPSCTFRDDNCEVHFDPDNQGGGPYSAPNDQNLQPAYQMCLSFSEQFSRTQMYNGALGNFEQDALDFWWTHSGDFVETAHVNQEQEYYYEFSAELFDPISISGGPDASTRWILEPEQTIGMSVSIDDADPGINANGNDPMTEDCCPDGFFWQAQYSMAEQFMNTGGMPDVFLTPIEPNPETAPELSMPDLQGAEGDIVTIPIEIVKASTVAGGDLTITYDPDILSFREVKNGELISGGDFVLVSNSSTSGRIVVSIAGARIIGQESGTLFELEFEAGEFQFGQANVSELRFLRRILTNEHGESTPTLSKNGSFTLQLGLPGDVNQDGSITSADAILVLRSAVELITLDATQRVLADVNEDGRIGSGDAVLILRKAVGLLAKVVVGTESSPKMAWGIPENRTDGKIAVPLLLEGDIYGGDFVVHYDVGVYKPAGVKIPGEMAVWVMDTNSLGELHFTAASAMPLRKLEVILERIEAEGASELLSLEEAFLVDGTGRSVKAEMSSVEVALAPPVSALPGQYALLANYPNPFNPSTTIRYDVPEAGSVVLRIYDVMDQMVRELVDVSQAAGRYSVMWDGRDASGERVANGVYLYELRAGDFRAIRKMVLMK